MKIAILYIATGKYTVFWKEFYESFEENFLPSSEKRYYVYTDDKKLQYADRENVCIIPQKNLGWPDNTIQRFALFEREQHRFEDADYTFFVNANFLCVQKITEEEFLPVEENLLVAEHAGAQGKKPQEMTYERNSKSLAYVPKEEGKYYVMGGLNGGKTWAYLDMIHELKRRVDEDARNGVIAKWHDESHLNRYIIGRTDVKILPPCFGYPEGWDLPYEAKMFIRDKSKYFDAEAVKAGDLKGRVKLYFSRIKRKIAFRKRVGMIKKWINRKKEL